MLIERVAREPFPAFMTRELFGPLGMKGTVLEEAGGVPDNTTTLYSWKKAGRVGPVDPSKAHYSCLAGAGAFLSTPSELARFGSAMLKPGFSKAETIATMQAPLQLESGRSTNYALGWKVESVPLAGKAARLVGPVSLSAAYRDNRREWQSSSWYRLAPIENDAAWPRIPSIRTG